MRVFILIWHQPFSFPGDSFAISLILLLNITLCIIRSLLWTSIDMTPSDQATNQWNYKWRKYWHFEDFMITFLLEKLVRSQYLCKKWINVIICVWIAFWREVYNWSITNFLFTKCLNSLYALLDIFSNKISSGLIKELMKTGSKGILLYKLFKSLYPVSSDENFEGYATFLI